MSRSRAERICNICGLLRKMSYEHIPPEAAFNDRRVVRATADAYWNEGGAGKRVRGPQIQGGHGESTICERCNNLTGHWYGPSFVEWCKEGLDFYGRTGGRAAVIQTHVVRPLPILKQIVTMFLAMNGHVLRAGNPDLVRFILNRDAKYLDPHYRIWVYYVAPGPLRKTPFCSQININTGQFTTGMEFSFPPFGYMMTFGSIPQDRRLFEITHFARYGYWDFERVVLNLNELPTHGPVLGDYRTFDRVDRDPSQPKVILDRDFERWQEEIDRRQGA